jgi:hypothetical protein
VQRTALLTAATIVLLAAPAPATAQLHDRRIAAVPLTFGSYHTSTNTSATVEQGEPLTHESATGCGWTSHLPDPDGVRMGKTLWYSVTGNGGILTAFTIGSDFDTVLGLYLDGDAMPIMCSDDYQQQSGGSSFLRFQTVPGQKYNLQLGGYCETPTTCVSGNTYIWVFAQPENDERASATALTLGQPLADGHNVGATEAPGETLTCNGAQYASTVWYRVDVSGPGTLTVNADGETFDRVVAVYESGVASPLKCVRSATAKAELSVTATAGRYLVQVGGVRKGIDPSIGFYDVNATFTPVTPPPEPRPPDPPPPQPPPPQPKPPRKTIKIPFKGGYQPGGLSRAKACRGKITVTLKRKKKTLQVRRTTLTRKCKYRVTFNVARSKVGSTKRLTVVVRFHGNSVLAATTNRFRVKVPQ